jgi:microcin C transport system substrate-binding protein
MMRILRSLLLIVPLPVLLCGCSREEEEVEQRTGLTEFLPRYNKYIREWVAEQQRQTEEEIAGLEAKVEEAEDDAARNYARDELAELLAKREMLLFRQGLGDYFAYKTPADIPEGLVWEDGLDQPELGDPAAKKGGTFRFYFESFSFPPTLREIGPDGNSSFRGEIYDHIQLGLVGIHPTTGGIMPGVANEWAEGPDGRTVYFHIDPDARYADGSELIMEDFFRAVWIRVSDNILEPYGKQYFREQLAQFAIYDERTISITLPNKRPMLPYYTGGGFEPAPEQFFSEYGPDYAERYNWKVAPTTGAYIVRDEDVKKGVSITLTRVENWWGEKKKFYRYRYNPDRIVYTLIRDRPKAWELFRAGEIDYFAITEPELWYDKSEMPPVFNGYVERRTWYNQYPRPPRGFYLNVHHKPLDDLNVRLGICYASNWQKVIDVVFRGDYQRLPGFTTGYGKFDDPTIQARPFSVTKAREYFKKGGFTREGRDGILINEEGKRLEITVTYPSIPIVENMMAILKDEARKAGFDMVLEPLEAMVMYKKIDRKDHRIAFMAWASTPPLPRYYENLHSRNAYDEKGNLKQDTNNVNTWAREDTDKLTVAYRNATSLEDVKRIGDELGQIMHDEALFVPGYMADFARIGTWRWIRWPDTAEEQIAPPGFYVPYESYCFWVDQEMRKETLEARRKGIKFPEVQETADKYRSVPGGREGQP